MMLILLADLAVKFLNGCSLLAMLYFALHAHKYHERLLYSQTEFSSNYRIKISANLSFLQVTWQFGCKF